MTPCLALQPTPGDFIDERGNEFDPSLDERDRGSDVTQLSGLNDKHKAAKCELDEAQLQLQRGHHRFANSSHAMNALFQLVKVLEDGQRLLPSFAISTLPHAHDGDDDPAIKALKTGCSLIHQCMPLLHNAKSELELVRTEAHTINGTLPALAERERDSRQLEERTDWLYRDHLSRMHQSEQLEHRCDAPLVEIADLPSVALSSDGRDFDRDIAMNQESPQVPAEDVFVPPATPPTHNQALIENLSTEATPSRSFDLSASNNLEEGELHDNDFDARPAHTACTQEQEDGQYSFPEPSDAIRPAHIIGGDSNQALRGPGTGGTGHPKPRQPYQPPRPDTVSIIKDALEEMRTRWPMNPTVSELCGPQLRTATPEDLPITLRSQVGAGLQQPDDFISLAAAPDIPDLFAKQADIDYKFVRKTVFVAVLVHALRIVRIHPDPTPGTSTGLATRVVEIFNEYGIDAEFWRSYPNMKLAVTLAFARAKVYHLVPTCVRVALPSLVAGQAVRPN